MKKGMIIIITLSFLFMVMPLFSFASSVSEVVTTLPEPDVYLTSDSSGVHLKASVVIYDPRNLVDYNYRLFTLTADAPVGSQFIIRCSSIAEIYLNCTSSFTYTFEEYDIENSVFIDSLFRNSQYASNDSWILVASGYNNYCDFWGHGSGPTNNSMYGYFIIPSSLSISSPPERPNALNWVVDPFVIWSLDIPDTQLYHSYMSEPVFDFYNRYFILAGSENQYIYWISYKFDDYSFIPYSNDPDEFYYIHVSSLFYPKISITNDIVLSIVADPNILSFLNSSLPTSVNNIYINYDLFISKFDLLSGQFISSEKFSLSQSSDSELIIDYDFGNIYDYDSVNSYGIYYENISRSPLNRLTCLWSVDPDFETWKASVENYLMLIYQSINPDDFSDPTVDDSYNSEVENYIEEESSLLDHYNESVLDDAVDDFGDNIDLIYSDNQSGFLFVNHLFDEFVFNLTIPEICIMLSLIFGFIILVLGKSVIK